MIIEQIVGNWLSKFKRNYSNIYIFFSFQPEDKHTIQESEEYCVVLRLLWFERPNSDSNFKWDLLNQIKEFGFFIGIKNGKSRNECR